jgi:uncharacterized protein (DUF58 family)
MLAALFLTPRWYVAMGLCSGLLVLAFFFPLLWLPARMLTLALLLLSAFDVAWLFSTRGGAAAERVLPARLSLGDENAIRIIIDNRYPFRANIVLIDELPAQFQQRDWQRTCQVTARGRAEIRYTLRPLSRGEYEFGQVLLYVSTPLGLARRRFGSGAAATAKVYPSFLRLRRYELLASAGSQAWGSRKTRRLGHSMEFEKIKNYVPGDDIRSINWKASARSADLMVNTYADTRQQQVYCFIDKGRAMKMPFDGLSLLDHAINAALALLHVALYRHDKAGLLTFSQKLNDFVPAERRSNQQQLLLETLYRQQSNFMESDYEALWLAVRRRVSQRSLVVLFTNFETMTALERQLPFLRGIARQHLLCVVFFQNTLLRKIHETQPDTVEGIYIKTIADRFDYDQRQIVKELRRHGIIALRTTPQSLSVDVINQYLSLKARQMI